MQAGQRVDGGRLVGCGRQVLSWGEGGGMEGRAGEGGERSDGREG